MEYFRDIAWTTLRNQRGHSRSKRVQLSGLSADSGWAWPWNDRACGLTVDIAWMRTVRGHGPAMDVDIRLADCVEIPRTLRDQFADMNPLAS